MMRCPLCTHASYTRTSRYITERTKEAYDPTHVMRTPP